MTEPAQQHTGEQQQDEQQAEHGGFYPFPWMVGRADQDQEQQKREMHPHDGARHYADQNRPPHTRLSRCLDAALEAGGSAGPQPVEMISLSRPR